MSFFRKRPTISPRAIKRLYQFGYICSGTAAGLMTLCLEEQRRRIQFLQRIADNAKAIRQHPRYNQHAVLAVESADGEVGSDEGVWLMQRRRRRRRSETGADRRERDVGVFSRDSTSSMAENQSSHDLEHNRLRNGDSISLDKLKDAHSFLPDGEHHTKAISPPTIQSMRPLPPLYAARRSKEDGEASVRRIQDENSSFRKFKAPDRGPTPTFPVIARWTAAGVETDSDAQRSDVTRAHFVTQSAWNLREDDVSEPILLAQATQEFSRADVSHDIDEFFKSIDSPGGVLLPFRHKPKFIATRLLELAVARGMLDEVRSLCLWKLSHGLFSKNNAFCVSNGCVKMAENNPDGLYELLGLYADIMASDSFGTLAAPVQLECGIRVLKNALQWELDVEPYRLCSELLGQIRRRPAEDDVIQALHHECKQLLSSKDMKLGADLLKAYASFSATPLECITIADEIINAAIETGQFSASITLLRWKMSLDKPSRALFSRPRVDERLDSCRNQLNMLIAACAERNLQTLLVDLFCRQSGALPISWKGVISLSRTSVKRLALASSTDPTVREAFETLYRRLAPAARESVDNEASVAIVKASWKSTRNLNTVQRYFSRMYKQIMEKNDISTLRKMEQAMVEIYISANKIDRALAMVARDHKKHSADSATMCLTALLFAKRGAWDMLIRVLALAKTSSTFSFDMESTRIFNEIIRVYSQSHSPSETWDLVSDSVRHLSFRPNRGTSMVLLRHFVSNQALDYIPKWLDFIKEHQVQFALDAQAAVALLRRYYMEHRPPYVQMMWLCRKFWILSPSLANEDLVDLVKQAIGYDLRHSRIRHSSQRLHMEARLQRLQDAVDHVPSPGLEWKDQLYFPPSNPEPEDVYRSLAGETEVSKTPKTAVSVLQAENSHAGSVKTRVAVLSGSRSDPDESNRSLVELNIRSEQLTHQKVTATTLAPEGLGDSIDRTQGRYSETKQQDNLSASNSVNWPRDNSDLGPSVGGESRKVESLSQNDVDNSETVDCAPFTPGYESDQTGLNTGSDCAKNGDEVPDLSSAQKDHFEESSSGDAEFWQSWSTYDATSVKPSTEFDQSSESSVVESQTTPMEKTSRSFRSLRPDYEEDYVEEYRSDHFLDTAGRKKLEGDMMTPFSLGQYEKVLDIYHDTLDASGLPASIRVLEIAVEACLRLHPEDKTQAERLMSNARFAGMNVTCAMGPMLIREMNNFRAQGRVNAEALRRTVIDYYRMNDENGWAVQHHVGVHAAHTLILSRHAAHGLNILAAIYTSEWAKHRTLNIVAMTVFLRGYIEMKSVVGIRWVIRTVLEKNMRINARFLQQLRQPLRQRNVHILEKMRKVSADVESLLDQWLNLCWERWQKQMAESYAFGQKLVKQIAASAAEDADTEISLEQLSPSVPFHAHDAKDALPAPDTWETNLAPIHLQQPPTSDLKAERRRRIAEYQREELWHQHKKQELVDEEFEERLPRMPWRARSENTWRFYRPTFEGHLVRDLVMRPGKSNGFKPGARERVEDKISDEGGDEDKEADTEKEQSVFRPFA